MREVSPAAAAAHLDIFRTAVVVPDSVFDGLSFREADLRRPRGRLDWDDYAVWLDRLGALVGDDAKLEALGGKMDETAPWITELLRLVVSPLQVLRFWTRMTPNIWRSMECSVTDLGRSRARYVIRILPGYRDCLTMMRSTVGAMPSSLRRVGLPPADVEAYDISPRHLDLRLRLPRSRTVPARARRAVEALLEYLDADGAELDRSHDELQRSRERLDGARAAAAAVGETSPTRTPALSKRERDVVTLARTMGSNKLIAYELGISASTVGVLLHRAATKLGARTRQELFEAFDRVASPEDAPGASPPAPRDVE